MSLSSVAAPAAKPGAGLPRVLVVGAGCTGALTAAFLRREARRRCSSEEGKDGLILSVWEWGRGPAGRMSSFWTEIASPASAGPVCTGTC